MNIVRVTMKGYGCEIARGTVSKKEYKKVEKSQRLDNVWSENLYCSKIKKEYKDINEQFHHLGLINGDLIVEVDFKTVIEMPINVVDTTDIVTKETHHYPKTDDVVVTSIQHQEGIVCDTMFIIDENFDIDKLEVIEKEIKGNIDIPLIPSLYCEIRYDGEKVPITGTITDLRMSRLFYDTHEKNNNRKF